MSVPQLLEEAQNKGITSVVVTDINNTSACLEFIREASKYNIKPIAGIDFRQGAKQHYIGIAKNNEGFLELNQHLSEYLSGKIFLLPRKPPGHSMMMFYQNCDSI